MTPRVLVPLAFCFLAAACSSENIETVTAPNSNRAAANASEPPYQVNATSIELRTGNSFQLLATKSANGKSVPDPSVTWSSDDLSIASISSDGLVTALRQGVTVVSALRGSHRVEVPVAVRCPVAPLPVGLTAGTITQDDCLFNVAGRRSDYYSVASPNGVVMGFIATGLVGIAGVKAETLDPSVGTVYGSRTIGSRFRVIGNGDPLQFFLSGLDSTKLGAYSLTRAIDAQPHTCNQLTYVVPGASFAGILTPANSCVYSVQFSPVSQAIGKPLNTHRYWIRLAAGKSYTVSVGGLTNSFDPAITIFPNILNGSPVAQSVPGASAVPSRSVTFTPSSEGYYLVEIASGRFIDNLVTWSVQTGSYTMSVSG